MFIRQKNNIYYILNKREEILMTKVNKETSFTCNDFDHENDDIRFFLKEMFTTQTMI